MRKKWWCFVLGFFSHVQHMPPPLPSKTPPPPPPKTTRKQASVDSGIVQWAETPAVGTNKQRPRHQVIRHHLVSNMLSVHSSRLLAGWRDGYLTLSAREQEVNSHLLPLRDFAFRWISLDQQLSDFHFKGESPCLLPPLCTEDCIYDFILFQVFCMWFDHDIFCINVSAALYTKWIKGLLAV